MPSKFLWLTLCCLFPELLCDYYKWEKYAGELAIVNSNVIFIFQCDHFSIFFRSFRLTAKLYQANFYDLLVWFISGASLWLLQMGESTQEHRWNAWRSYHAEEYHRPTECRKSYAATHSISLEFNQVVKLLLCLQCIRITWMWPSTDYVKNPDLLLIKNDMPTTYK